MSYDIYDSGVRYWWANEESEKMLNGGYLLKGESIENAVDRIVGSATKRLDRPDLFPVMKEIIEKGWISLSSPVWANMGTDRGLPISCFNVHVPDDMAGITTKFSETVMQTKYGGGTSGYFGALRGRGEEVKNNGKATGAVSFMKLFDTVMSTVSQGEVRKGAFAAYLDIDHHDINEFLEIRDIGNPIQNLFTGVCVSDAWMQSMIDGNKEKRDVWAKVIKSRKDKGMPYVFFTDNVNNNKAEVYKALDIKINSSNLCSEIMLPSNDNESFVCCLASMNLDLYDEWKDTNAVQMAVYLLDAVMSEFIEKTESIPYLDSANRFSKRHRALGLGVLGWHSYLQRNMIPFGSLEANMLTNKIFAHIEMNSKIASVELGEAYGYAPIFDEVTDVPVTKMRNATLLAIAPTTSSSSILGQVSAGIEPFESNCYKVGLAKGNFVRKNKRLIEVLSERNMNTAEIWNNILANKGSIQQLDLPQEIKDVFKTFAEISQMDIITQASIRQKYIDQSQSLNINIPEGVAVKDVNALMIEAWKLGVKTIYYQRSNSVSKDFIRNVVSCSSCEA